MKEFTQSWRDKVTEELENGKKRLEWVTTLSHEFSEWVKTLDFRIIRVTEEDEGIVSFAVYTEDKKKKCTVFSAILDDENECFYRYKMGFLPIENHFLSHMFKQFDWKDLLEAHA